MCLTLAAAGPAWAAGGVAFSFGNNSGYRTGLGTNVGTTSVATPIDATNLGDLRITQASASIGYFLGSGNYGLVLAEDGAVFAFGTNTNGRTGQGTIQGETPVATAIRTDFLGGLRITQASAGGTHNLLLADDGTVFAFGSNAADQLGIPGAGNVSVATPIVMHALEDLAVVQVSAGEGYSLLLAEDGSVYSFGDDYVGQTGQGRDGGVTSTLTSVATRIDLDALGEPSIAQISAGAHHALLLAADGRLLSFGTNEHGRTCLGTSTGNTLVPTIIDAGPLAGATIVQVAAGSRHSLLLAADGTVFSCGDNADGAAGQGMFLGSTLVPTPIDAGNLGARRIVRVAAGGHSLLLAEDGSVFSFGSNGQTGLGTTGGFTRIATAIDRSHLGSRLVVDLSAGAFHSLLVAAPEPASAGGAAAVALAILAARRRAGKRAQLVSQIGRLSAFPTQAERRGPGSPRTRPST